MQAWITLYSKYLLYMTAVYGAPAFQQFGLGGALLSSAAGGFIARKSVHEWLYGAPR